MKSKVQRVLILCKTYPSPSAKYSETSCVAGMDDSGNLIRLYPVPFRLVSDDRQFKKWQWINVRLEKASKDHRPESHKLYVDTIECDDKPLSTKNLWRDRRVYLDKIQKFNNFDELEDARNKHGTSLALLKPEKIISLEIKAVDNPEWSEQEKQKLLSLQQQGNLFDDTDEKSIRLLRKLPYDFHYIYECNIGDEKLRYKHKIVDWEVGALFWNVYAQHKKDWEIPFRKMIEENLAKSDLMFLMGTIHRFPNQWLIVSLIYPPMQQPEQVAQQSLF
ncbi:MAG: hypothetical protein KFB94_05850 [Methylophilaceae bacterium]|nr:MAG: hypothetical protein KFB94_05850 [Methylophilaceae bacterium]